VWSLLDDKISNENVVLNKNALIFKGFKNDNLGSYECSSSYETILHRIEFSLERSDNMKNQINGRTKSYIIESINSKLNDIPQIRLDFITSIENIQENSMVEIRCSSSTSNAIRIFLKLLKMFLIFLYKIRKYSN
jgi:hypothetical protein